MHAVRTFLEDLALVLCVAAVASVLFRRLRQPVVLGYLLAGLIVGPHIPIPLFADADRIHALAELGVILVMFSVGLEFSIRKLVRLLPTSGVVGLIQISSMMWLGYVVGQAFGWSTQQSVFVGGIVAISSTIVVAKAFAEHPVSKPVSDTVFGVLVVQDLAAVLLLAVLTATSSGRGQPAEVLARTVGQLGAFLVVTVVVGFFVIPRGVRAIKRLGSPETLLVAGIGLCFALALVAKEVGYSVALGGFLAGSLVAESGEGKSVERLVRPVRDVFAAIFFVAVGMILDPAVLVEHWLATVVLVLVVVVGQMASVTVGAFLSGRDVKTSVQAGMILAQIGEFSFIIASVGVASGAVEDFLYPVAVAVSVITTFATPWLIRASSPVAVFIDRRLPKPVQTFVSLYGSWLDQIRARAPAEKAHDRPSRLVRLLALDALLLAGIAVGAALGTRPLLGVLRDHAGVPLGAGRWLIVGGALALSGPFVIGVVRLARALGLKLAAAALPEVGPGKVDLAAAPRRVLVVTLQIGVVLLVGMPLLAVTSPFVSPVYGGVALAVIVAVLAVAFWRSATNLQQHVQAGSQMIVEALGRQSARAERPSLDQAAALLPGLGALTPVRLEPTSPAIGKTLVQLDLRGLSGASVVSILRGEEGIVPTGREALHEGDILALAGTHDAIELATELLVGASAAAAH